MRLLINKSPKATKRPPLSITPISLAKRSLRKTKRCGLRFRTPTKLFLTPVSVVNTIRHYPSTTKFLRRATGLTRPSTRFSQTVSILTPCGPPSSLCLPLVTTILPLPRSTSSTSTGTISSRGASLLSTTSTTLRRPRIATRDATWTRKTKS